MEVAACCKMLSFENLVISSAISVSPVSYTHLYEYDTEIQGFIGLNDEYVEGIFVSGEMQSQGIRCV